MAVPTSRLGTDPATGAVAPVTPTDGAPDWGDQGSTHPDTSVAPKTDDNPLGLRPFTLSDGTVKYIDDTTGNIFEAGKVYPEAGFEPARFPDGTADLRDPATAQWESDHAAGGDQAGSDPVSGNGSTDPSGHQGPSYSLTPHPVRDLKTAASDVKGAIKGAVDWTGLGDLLGNTNVDTAQLASQLSKVNGLSDQFNTDYKSATPGTAPVAAAGLVGPVERAGTQAPITAQQIQAAQIAAYQAAVGPGAVQAGQSTAAVSDPSIKAALANYDTTNELQSRSGQDSLIAGLNGAIAGTDPSVAAIMLRQATDRNVANQYALATSAPGMNAGLAERQAMLGASDLNSQAAASQAILRAKEITDARAQLADVLGTQRTGDINVATTQYTTTQGVNNDYATAQNTRSGLNAQLANQTGIANAGNTTSAAQTSAQLAAQIAEANAKNEADRASQQATLDQGASTTNAGNSLAADTTTASLAQAIALANAKAANDASTTNANNTTSTNQYNAGATLTQKQIDEKNKQDAAGNTLTASGQGVTAAGDMADAQAKAAAAKGQLVAGLAGAYAASDRRAKTDIKKSSDADMSKLLSVLGKSYEYRYKEPDAEGAAPGKNFGPMAQDIEKSKIGKSMIRETADGKMVDLGRAVMAALSGLGAQNKRLDKIERRAA